MASPACCVLCQSLENLQWCSKCKLVAYCSREHQKQHWKVHKKLCGKQSGSSTLSKSMQTLNNVGKNISDLEISEGNANSSTAAMTSTPPSKELSLLWTAQNSVPMEPFNEDEVTDLESSKVKTIWATMKKLGLCIVDDFLPEKEADELLSEVVGLYGTPGKFADGEIVKQGSNLGTQRIRSDRIVWIDEDYHQCKSIQLLCKRMDLMIHLWSKFHMCKVLNRTKPMVSCYPGNGTHYKKHVDNPSGDGRLVTCLYYLNKGWDIKKEGGALCLYPKLLNKQKVVCEPLFNRLLMFFSDQRNPHEVLPAFKERFAVTCWYFDHEERERALQQWSQKYPTSTSQLIQ